jgi:uncharacterized tellurite resistance protein B-like protein
VSVLLRFLGLRVSVSEESPVDGTFERIAAELEGLSPERARFFAGFAYVLARVAGADLRIAEREIAAMEALLVRFAGVSPAEASLAVRIAHSEVERLGGTHDFLVTRELGRMCTPEERLQLIECLVAVAAADDLVTTAESHDIFRIAAELGVPRGDVLAIRARFRDQLAELKPLAGERR